LAKLQFVIIF